MGFTGMNADTPATPGPLDPSAFYTDPTSADYNPSAPSAPAAPQGPSTGLSPGGSPLGNVIGGITASPMFTPDVTQPGGYRNPYTISDQNNPLFGSNGTLGLEDMQRLNAMYQAGQIPEDQYLQHSYFLAGLGLYNNPEGTPGYQQALANYNAWKTTWENYQAAHPAPGDPLATTPEEPINAPPLPFAADAPRVWHQASMMTGRSSPIGFGGVGGEARASANVTTGPADWMGVTPQAAAHRAKLMSLGLRDSMMDQYQASLLGLDPNKARLGDPETLASIDWAYDQAMAATGG